MRIPTATASALTTIRQGMRGLDRNAADIANSNGSPDAATLEALVDGKRNRLQVEAGVKVLQTVDDMLGSLLDEHA